MCEKATYHHGNLRSALLEAAFSLLLEGGVEGLSLRGVARRAGVSPSAPYHHFRDKGMLLAELAEDRRQRAGRTFIEAMAGVATPTEKLRALGVAYVGYTVAHPEEFRLMFGGSLESHLPESVQESAPALNLFKEVVRAVDGSLDEEALEVAAITVWSVIHGLAQLLIDSPIKELGHDPVRVNELTEQVLDGLVLLRGVS